MAGWNEWVPGTNMTLSEVLDALKSASIGLDVKDKLYWSFFKVVQEAVKEGNANFDVEMAKGHFKDLASRLDAGDTDMRNISVDWINKNLGKLDQTYMTEEFLQMMAGNTPINAVPAINSLINRQYSLGSVSADKTNFISHASNNFFNKFDMKNGYSISDTNIGADNPNLGSSNNFSRIDQNSDYTTRRIFRVLLYDANYNFVKAINSLDEVTTFNSGACVYHKAVVHMPNYDTAQLNKGTSLLDYEAYKQALDKTIAMHNAPKYIDDFGAVGDGVADDTLALQSALNKYAGHKINIPPKEFMVTGTLSVKSGTRLVGHGAESKFKLGDNYALTATDWRGANFYSIIRTAENSKGIKFDSFSITGHKTEFQNKRMFGLGVVDTENVEVKDIWIDYINFFPSEAETSIPVLAWNLGLLRAKNIKVNGGNYEFGGYECIGTEDVDNVIFNGVRTGVGWRTSLQLHRNSKNIKILDCTIEQDLAVAHAALTLHGAEGNTVENVLIDGCTIDSLVLTPGGYAVQSVDGFENNIKVINNDITSSNRVIHTPVAGGASTSDWVIKGNTMRGQSGIVTRSNNTIISDNIIDTIETAINHRGDNHVIHDNVFKNNAEVLVN